MILSIVSNCRLILHSVFKTGVNPIREQPMHRFRNGNVWFVASWLTPDDREIDEMKAFLTWRTDWLVGFEALDRQHLSLAGLLNQIFDTLATDTAGANPRLQHLLSTLAEQTRRHFLDEEACMREHGYPQLPEHHREHAMLLAELQELMREIEEGRRRFTLETLTALKHWQIDHVLNSDKVFADFVRRSPAGLARRGDTWPYRPVGQAGAGSANWHRT